MLAITIWQPWASLLACGAKHYETRSWATFYRGPIAIHAAALKVPQVFEKCFPMPGRKCHQDYQAKMEFLDAVAKGFGWSYAAEEIPEVLGGLPAGAIIATAELVNVWYIVPHPGPNSDEAKYIPVGPESMATGEHSPTSFDYFAPSEMELALGNWSPGRYVWELKDVKPVVPIPAKGQQGLWWWDPPTQERTFQGNMRSRECKSCGVSFDEVGDQQFCPACWAKLRWGNEIRLHKCAQCGVVFPGGPNARYCPSCRAERSKIHSRDFQRRQAAGTVRYVGTKDICPICGKEYLVSRGPRKYCPDCSPSRAGAIQPLPAFPPVGKGNPKKPNQKQTK